MVVSAGIFLVLALLLAGPATADLYVAASGDNSTGADWATALTSLQAAFDAAQPGDAIYLKGETFLTAAQLLWTQSLVSIRGGYAGNTVGGLPGERDLRQWPTVIQRDGTAVHRVLQVLGVTNSLLDGVVLRNGQSSGKDAGAGLHVTFCSNLTVSACAIAGNLAYNPTSNLGNLEGAGVYMSNSYATVSNCLIAGNTNQTLYGSTISHALGGGLAVLTGAVTITECLVMDNVLIAARNAYGAGVYMYNGTHRIENTVVQGNYAPLSSGGLTYNRGDGLHVGGAGARVRLFNSLINANYRDGVHVDSGDLQVVNSTITGHGRFGASRTNGVLALTNSIVWQNGQDVGGVTAALGWSLVGDGTGFGTNGVIRADPLFERGLYLATTSPARNAGNGTAAGWGLAGRTTSTNGDPDADAVDLGYHFRPGTAASAADAQVQFDPARADLHVAATGDDTYPGTEAEPFRSVTRALAGASAGTRIHVGAGAYTNGIETFPLGLDKPGLQLLGAGAAGTVVSARGVTNSRVLTARGVTGDGRLAGLTFTGSTISKTAAVTGAPALLAYNTDAFWRARRGGGLQLVNCAMTLDDVTISSNMLRGAANEHILGGGLYGLWSWGVMSNGVVVSNVLADGQSNTGDGYGGGAYLYGGQWLITHSSLSSNLAGFGNNGGNYGGGACLVGDHTLARSLIAGNILAGQAGALRRGGGLYLNGGLVRDCRIATNRMTTTTSTNANGGGVFMAGGALRNCLLTENTAIRNGGGLYAINASALESLTVAGNHGVDAGYVAGVFLAPDAGTMPGVTNSIFAHNYRDFDAADVSVSDTGGTLVYSCTRPGRAGTGNVDADPGFADYTTGDYHLAPGSPAMDTALDQSWMTNALDLDGNARIRNLIPDMGAFEAPGPNDGPFQASFAGTPLQGMDALAVVFTAAVQGSNTTGVVYSWDFDNNGAFDQWGSDKQVVTNLYTPGRYSVRMLATNAVGETNETVKPNYIFVSPTFIYAAAGGDHSDGTTWTRAFTNIAAALDAAWQSNTICLAGETFWLHEALTWSGQTRVSILGGFEGAGSPGARNPAVWPTVLRRNPAAGNFRLLYISAVFDGLLSGMTFADGYTADVAGSPAPGSGGAIRLSDSTLAIEDCIFTNNQCRTSGNSIMWGGALFAESSGLAIRGTLFANNLAYGGPVASANNRALGGGLAANACTVTVSNCRFLGNTADAGGWYGNLGGGLYLSGNSGLVRNTLVAFNRAGPNRPRAQGGGIHLGAGMVLENVTVVSNQIWNDGSYYGTTAGGIYAGGGGVTNAIAYHNVDRTAGAPSDVYAADLTLFAYSCANELGSAGTGNTDQDPRFDDLAGGQFTPLASSPCRNAGLTMAWMTNATDLAGRPRLLSGRVDMGAYESPPPPGSMLQTR